MCAGRAACIYNPFFEVCNVAMNLWLAKEHLSEGFLLLYDDVLFEDGLLQEATEHEGDIVLVVDRKGVDREAEKVVLRGNLVTAIGKDVPDPFGEFIGVARFSERAVPTLLHALDQVARTDLGTSFPRLVEQLVEGGQDVHALATERPWSDIDFPADLEEARRLWSK
jgi:choline kinase